MTKRKDRAGPGKVGRKENDRTESDVYGRSRKKRVEKKGCSRKERLGLGGATKISDTGVSQNGKKREKKRKKRKKNRAREKVGWRKEKEREQKKIRSTCILFVTRLPEARSEGDSSGEEGATEVGLGSFHTKARIYDKGGPLTPWHLASKLTLLPT